MALAEWIDQKCMQVPSLLRQDSPNSSFFLPIYCLSTLACISPPTSNPSIYIHKNWWEGQIKALSLSLNVWIGFSTRKLLSGGGWWLKIGWELIRDQSKSPFPHVRSKMLNSISQSQFTHELWNFLWFYKGTAGVGWLDYLRQPSSSLLIDSHEPSLFLGLSCLRLVHPLNKIVENHCICGLYLYWGGHLFFLVFN